MINKRSNKFEELKITRRTFNKGVAALGAAAALGGYAGQREFFKNDIFRLASAAEDTPGTDGTLIKTICSHCAVGCGVLGNVKDGELISVEPWEDHPINHGGMCSKGTAIAEMVNSERRLRYPMEKVNGKWVRISWDDAINKISSKMTEIRDNYGPDSVMFMGSAKMTNEECYLFRKMAAFWGTNNVDHQARICHSTTVQGLGNTWGFGAQTNNVNDMRHTKCAFFMGSNAAEAHPVSMQHFLTAKDRGAKLIVVDPRFTRTAGKADIYARMRPGTDIPILLGIVNVLVNNGWHDEEFIKNRTIGFEDLWEIAKDYTPEVVENISWVPADSIRLIARTMYENKPSTIVWAMGQTQHSVGTNNIRMDAIVSLVLGHAGMSGGGVQPLRGHDNVQGSTDMCVLSHSLPSYYGLSDKAWGHWVDVWNTKSPVTMDWMKGRFDLQNDPTLMNKNGFTVSRWYEGAILPEDQIDQPHNIKMVFVWGHSLNSITEMKRMKEALEKVDLVVSVDPHSTIASALPERDNGIISLPASTVFEKDGTVTTTGRQVQWRNKLVEPRFDSKPDSEIIQMLTTKLGFGEHFTYSGPEEIVREWNLGMGAIAMTGQTPERLKRQQEHCADFDVETTRATGGPCKGEYYGMPWPCWTPDHCGTPILYDINKPVSDGGHDFRANWGVTVPENPTGKHIGDDLLRGDKPVAQVGYAYDLTLDTSREALARGDPPTGRARARIWAWNLPDPVPIHREPIESPRPDLIENYPTYDDVAFQYRVPAPYITNQTARKHIVDKYPVVLSSGRQVEHMGGGAETRSCPYTVELAPEMYAEISPALAADIGVKHWDFVWVETLRGKCKVRANVTKAMTKTPEQTHEVAFMPYHWAGIFEGKSYEDRYPPGTAELALGDSVNIICGDGYDRSMQMQETKVCQCKIYPA